MDKIVEMNFGSLVYGTNLPTSDQDFKMVYIPEAEDILLGRIKNTIINHSNKQRNTNQDVDYESYAYQYFIKLLCSGQTVFLDMIFTPTKYWISATSDWEEIVSYRDKLISKSLYPFVGYCRSQAMKYSIKGSRLKEAKQSFELLKEYYNKNPNAKVEEAIPSYNKLIDQSKHIKIVTQKNTYGVEEIYLVVCEKMIPVKATMKFAYVILKSLLSEYGKRSQETEINNYDCKALYHAFRVAYEALELLTTGKITFPRPEAEFLLEIRRGQCVYDELQYKLDLLVQEIEEAMKVSTLREKPDLDLADRLVLKVYKRKVQV